MKSERELFILSRLGFVLVIIVMSLQWVGCGSSDSPLATTPISEKEEVAGMLMANPWRSLSVTIDGVNQDLLFPDFLISFTSTGFTTTNGGPVWPPNGTWSFTDDNANAFVRGDGIQVTIAEISSGSLRLELVWNESTIGSGKVQSIAGTHVFQLAP